MHDPLGCNLHKWLKPRWEYWVQIKQMIPALEEPISIFCPFFLCNYLVFRTVRYLQMNGWHFEKWQELELEHDQQSRKFLVDLGRVHSDQCVQAYTTRRFYKMMIKNHSQIFVASKCFFDSWLMLECECMFRGQESFFNVMHLI